MGRRYKVGTHPEYDKKFDWLKSQSPILNPHGFGVSAELLAMGNKAGLIGLIREREGDDRGDGTYIQDAYGGNRRLAAIPARLQELRDIDRHFALEKKQAANTGTPIPETMPEHMIKKKLEIEAAHDIFVDEVAAIRRALEKVEEQESEDPRNQVLPRGPVGHRKLREGICVWADGQNVEPDAKGVLRISDERSPYNGMAVSDYVNHVSIPFQEAQMARLMASYEGKPLEPLNLRPPWPDAVPRPKLKREKTADE